MGWRRRALAESGQASPEWVALLALVALLFLALLLAMHGRLPGAALGREIAARMLCAVRLSDACREDPPLDAAYGPELARIIREQVPAIAYEQGMSALPVDFRHCREAACAAGASSGEVGSSLTGESVTLFTRVVDCRRSRPGDTRCAGAAGNLYIQYWEYYPDSATLRGVPIVGRAGYHADDWEGVQVRLGPHGAVSTRATSHHGYNYAAGRRNWGSDAGIAPVRWASEEAGLRPRGGWGPATGWLFVSGGSHAGAVRARRGIERYTLPRDIRFVPIEPNLAAFAAYRFEPDPPWVKPVYRDPESNET
jgi:hypothetical protein